MYTVSGAQTPLCVGTAVVELDLERYQVPKGYVVMSEPRKTKLTDFMREAFNWRWDEFALAEVNEDFTSNEAVVFAVIRAATMQKIDAVRIALNRLDGKLKTPVQIEYPKVYRVFPYATEIEGQGPIEQKSPDFLQVTDDPNTVNEVRAIVSGELLPPKQLPTPEAGVDLEEELMALSLRQTLAQMGDYPRMVPKGLVKLAEQVDNAVRKGTPMPDEIPHVKSVVAAHLLLMAQRRNIDALYETFDQIEGKLVETLQLVGEDITLISYSTVAPAGATLNADGVLQIEASETQNTWAEKLNKGKS